MKLQFRLTLIITLMTIVIIAAVSLVILNRSQTLQTEVAFENMRNLSIAESIHFQERFEV